MGTCRQPRNASSRKGRVAALKGRLLVRQRELLAKVKGGDRLSDKSTAFHAADVTDRAVHSSTEDMALKIVEMRLGEILQIEEALQKMVNGTYGLCEWCRRKIPAARLELLPEATLCVACQAEFERERGSDEFSAEWERVEMTEESASGFTKSCSASKF